MATLVLKDVGIWIDGLSYAGVSNAISLEGSADTPEKTLSSRTSGRLGQRVG